MAENALDLLSVNGYTKDTGKMFKDASVEMEVL